MLKSVAFSLVGLAVAGSLATASPASAAGGYPPYGSIKDAPPPAPVYFEPPAANWGGAYLGFHAGYGWADSSWNFRELSIFGLEGERFSRDAQGWFGGGQIGYNWQSGKVVWGLEGTLSGSDIDHSSTNPLDPDQRVKTEIDMMWSITGRLGYDWGGLLTYVKAGYAGANVEISAFDPDTLPDPTRASKSSTHNGWTVGGGLEYLVSPNIILGLEYTYTDFGDKTTRGLDSEGDVFAVKNDVTMHAVMARFSYKFDSRSYSPFK